MTENFLHYIWKTKLLNNNNLITTNGEKVEIVSAGEYNTHAGPDFSNAKIRIGKTLWAGNVEIHVNSSDWRKHNHTADKAYNNVVLHCVYEADEAISNNAGKEVPCLEMKDKFNSQIYERYQALLKNEQWIACETQLSSVSDVTISSWLERLMVERLEIKTALIKNSLRENKNNWEETFYQSLCRSFGAKINAEPFEWLAKSLPVKVLAKHKNNLFQLEALLFGTAGFLDKNFKEEYPNQLKKEYSFLQKKHSLKPIEKHLWKFLRLRPVNFPTVRLAQLAALIHRSSHLFSKILEASSIKELEKLFTVQPSAFWDDHYSLDKSSARKAKPLGKDFIQLLLINTIIPLIFLYGKEKDEERYMDKALKLLEHLPAEKNSIITRWEELGIKAGNAFRSQALLELKNVYCKQKRCLECGIGNKLLRTNNT